MAVKNAWGFDSLSLLEAVGTTGTVSVSSSTTRGSWSAGALRCNPTTTNVGAVSLGEPDVKGVQGNLTGNLFFVRFYFNYATKPGTGAEPVASWGANVATSTALELRLDSSGVFKIYNSVGTLLGTGTTALFPGTWYRIDFKLDQTVSGTLTYEVRIDGVSELSGSFATGATGQAFRLGKNFNRSNQTVDFFFDDVLLDDAAYPPPGRVTFLPTDANGTYQTWTIGAGSGAHWQVVNAVPPAGAGSYLQSTLVANDTETEGLLGSAGAGITGFIPVVKSFVVLASASGSSTVRLRFRSAATDTDTGTNVNPGTTYAALTRVFTTDPATALGWTAAGVDGIEVGVINRDTVVRTRLTLAGAVVAYTVGTDTVGTSAGSSTATAVGASTKAASGAATGSGSAAGAALSTGAAAGGAVGSSTASAASFIPAGSRAFASGSCSVVSVGLAVHDAVGTAEGAGAAAAEGSAAAVAVGTAEGTSFAEAYPLVPGNLPWLAVRWIIKT